VTSGCGSTVRRRASRRIDLSSRLRRPTVDVVGVVIRPNSVLASAGRRDARPDLGPRDPLHTSGGFVTPVHPRRISPAHSRCKVVTPVPPIECLSRKPLVNGHFRARWSWGESNPLVPSHVRPAHSPSPQRTAHFRVTGSGQQRPRVTCSSRPFAAPAALFPPRGRAGSRHRRSGASVVSAVRLALPARSRGEATATRMGLRRPPGLTLPRRESSSRRVVRTVSRPSDHVVDGLSVTGGISRLRTSSITASASHHPSRRRIDDLRHRTPAMGAAGALGRP
jgi:hypothetical protein